MTSLTRTGARDRAAVVSDLAYAIDLDLTQGAEVFGSVTRLTFAASPTDATSFLDLKAREVHEVTLNGVPLDLATWSDGRLPLPALAEHNELVVRATMPFRHDGSGLHRSTDPADREDYVYGHSFMDAAPSIYACFDQPDLKAPHTVTVRVPEHWVVIGNGAATVDDTDTNKIRNTSDTNSTHPGSRLWRLATTQPIATYFFSVCAGPYVSVTEEHDGIPLGLFARASLRPQLERNAPQMLEVTRRCFDYYHRLFGIRYPFGRYDQVFVPDFNAGAMENPGCVVIRDEYLYRGAVAPAELLTRDNTIAHEMAHMWFGDLVTLDWWDDLWLNESFAEFLASRAVVDTGLYPDAWAHQSIVRKAWGYAAERSPSTHPVASNGSADALSALQNFDGISYAKGCAVLRQLIAYIGDDVFDAGVRDYLQAHAFANATLTDFVGALEARHGASLDAWRDSWLTTAGVDSIACETDATGSILTGARLTRTAPPEHPADRSHVLDVAGFTDGAERWREPLVLDAASVPMPSLTGRPRAALVLPNASDLTWATVRLDDASLADLPRQLSALEDLDARCVVWNALFDGLALATVDPRLFLACVEAAWPLETHDSVRMAVATRTVDRVIALNLPADERPGALARVAAMAANVLAVAPPASGAALAAARLLARTSADESLLRRWLDGVDLPSGLEGDADFRWGVLRTMARAGLVDAARIDEVRESDRTVTGTLAWLAARGALPDSDAKAWAWEQLTGQHGLTNHEMNNLALGFWSSGSEELLRGYRDRYLVDVPAMKAWVGDDALARVARFAFPLPVVEQATDDAVTAALDSGDLTAAVSRAMVDQRAILREVLASRAAFPARA